MSDNTRLQAQLEAKKAAGWERIDGLSVDAVMALLAENKTLRQALQAITTQVDGNIRPTVRDCINGQNNVQDIYGYCDQIEAIAAAAMKEPQPCVPDAGAGMLPVRLQKHGAPGEVYRCPSHSGSHCSLCGGSGYRSICNQTACHEHGCQAKGCARSVEDFERQQRNEVTP